jgi:hypothetical protein
MVHLLGRRTTKISIPLRVSVAGIIKASLAAKGVTWEWQKTVVRNSINITKGVCVSCKE